MSRYLVLSFRFLSPWFHGRGDEGAPEWPPSPMRAFQAVVAAAARAGMLESTRDALTWLEQRAAPLIVAPDARESTVGYRLSVPHNAMDLVGKQWSRGDEGSAAEHRTMKNVRPHRLPEDAVVHYAWQLDGDAPATPSLIVAARGVVALGWGVDLVVGDGAVVEGARLAELSAQQKVWEPRSDGRLELRAPTRGTLDDLDRRHAAFLSRTSLSDSTLRPPLALSAFAITGYARTDQPSAADIAGFTLMRVESDNFRAFDTARRGMTVAGMLRHAVRTAAERAGWDEARVRASVLGHGDESDSRLLLVPVPSIEPRDGGETVGAVRRVMVFSTNGRSNDTAWAARVLGGMDLIDEKTGEVQAVLAATSRNDRVLNRYVSESFSWATVTPLLLPGHDDPSGLREKLRKTKGGEEQKLLLGRLMKRREGLVRKALRQAGLGDDLAFSAEIQMSETGFIAGVEKASRYAVPSHLAKSPRLHVKLTWPVKVAGPLCIGRGRFSGLGLFATMIA
ncbi:MAG TPA: type I-U CRISPR-associated protein Csb2 [Polyangiaceae bacterium]|jgi:CRISPR-associated protein Csb2|nr:type I-U CRISPR-associated protein Csb2 [Polyangiaceae bacterium]